MENEPPSKIEIELEKIETDTEQLEHIFGFGIITRKAAKVKKITV